MDTKAKNKLSLLARKTKMIVEQNIALGRLLENGSADECIPLVVGWDTFGEFSILQARIKLNEAERELLLIEAFPNVYPHGIDACLSVIKQREDELKKVLSLYKST